MRDAQSWRVKRNLGRSSRHAGARFGSSLAREYAPRLLIINADDFGLSTSINRAILEAFDRGIVSSTTVMPTQEGFDEACALAQERGLQRHVGLHLVLTAGIPLTDAIKRCRRFCDADGAFLHRRATGRILRLSSGERDAMIAELRAQVEACRLRRLPVTHLDSHHHVHTELGIWPSVVGAARELGIPYVRLAPNCRRNPPFTTWANRTLFNRRLRRAGLAATRYVGDVDDYRRLRNAGAPAAALRDFELMTHPALDQRDQLVDYHCSQAGLGLERVLADVEGADEAVSFAGARYRSG